MTVLNFSTAVAEEIVNKAQWRESSTYASSSTLQSKPLKNGSQGDASRVVHTLEN
jgi:hypothetical protein